MNKDNLDFAHSLVKHLNQHYAIRFARRAIHFESAIRAYHNDDSVDVIVVLKSSSRDTDRTTFISSPRLYHYQTIAYGLVDDPVVATMDFLKKLDTILANIPDGVLGDGDGIDLYPILNPSK